MSHLKDVECNGVIPVDEKTIQEFKDSLKEIEHSFSGITSIISSTEIMDDWQCESTNTRVVDYSLDSIEDWLNALEINTILMERCEKDLVKYKEIEKDLLTKLEIKRGDENVKFK